MAELSILMSMGALLVSVFALCLSWKSHGEARSLELGQRCSEGVITATEVEISCSISLCKIQSCDKSKLPERLHRSLEAIENKLLSNLEKASQVLSGLSRIQERVISMKSPDVAIQLEMDVMISWAKSSLLSARQLENSMDAIYDEIEGIL
jgi:hypothetical protein